MPGSHFAYLASASKGPSNEGDPQVKLTSRAGVVAGLLVGAVALAACSSSKSNSSGSSDTGSSTPPASSTPAANTNCGTGTITANGSSAQGNAMTAWVTAYQKACPGATVNYTATNSGQGVADFTAGKIAFGGSDSALDPTKGEPAAATTACGSPALDIPMVVGPIAVAYNLSGVSDLTLTPTVLTKIFLGKITKWDDAAIKAINSGVTLPSSDIKVFFRNDPSGTNKNFEKYLSKNDATDWGSLVVDKPWPGKTGSGVSGSAAVASGVKSTPGGIGYMEWSYAGNNQLSTAKIDNGGGAVALSTESAGAAVAAATITGTGDDLSLKLDYGTKTAGAYPIVLVTYEIVCTKYKDSGTGTQVKDFLTYTASAAGQGLLAAQGYAPLPASILAKVQATVAKIS